MALGERLRVGGESGCSLVARNCFRFGTPPRRHFDSRDHREIDRDRAVKTAPPRFATSTRWPHPASGSQVVSSFGRTDRRKDRLDQNSLRALGCAHGRAQLDLLIRPMHTTRAADPWILHSELSPHTPNDFDPTASYAVSGTSQSRMLTLSPRH